jgi:hypothetical protein
MIREMVQVAAGHWKKTGPVSQDSGMSYWRLSQAGPFFPLAPAPEATSSVVHPSAPFDSQIILRGRTGRNFPDSWKHSRCECGMNSLHFPGKGTCSQDMLLVQDRVCPRTVHMLDEEKESYKWLALAQSLGLLA